MIAKKLPAIHKCATSHTKTNYWQIVSLLVTLMVSLIGYTVTIFTNRSNHHTAEIQAIISQKQKLLSQTNAAISSKRKIFYNTNISCQNNVPINKTKMLSARSDSVLNMQSNFGNMNVLFPSPSVRDAEQALGNIAKRILSQCGKPNYHDFLLEESQRTLEGKLVESINNNMKLLLHGMKLFAS